MSKLQEAEQQLRCKWKYMKLLTPDDRKFSK